MNDTNTHIHTHTYIHTYIHTQTHIQRERRGRESGERERERVGSCELWVKSSDPKVCLTRVKFLWDFIEISSRFKNNFPIESFKEKNPILKIRFLISFFETGKPFINEIWFINGARSFRRKAFDRQTFGRHKIGQIGQIGQITWMAVRQMYVDERQSANCFSTQRRGTL